MNLKLIFTVALLLALVSLVSTHTVFACQRDGQFCLGKCSYVVCTNGSPIPMPLPAGTMCVQTGNTITLAHDWNGVCRLSGSNPTQTPTPTPTPAPTRSTATASTPTPTPTPTPTATPTATATPTTTSNPNVRLRSLTSAGSGCPAGSFTVNMAPDGQAFTVAFSNLVAELGPGIDVSKSRRNCQLNLDLDYPPGYTFTIMNVDYRGYANLDAGVFGKQVATYYFQGSVVQKTSQTQLQGPTTGDYLRRDTLGLESVVWAPCSSGSRSLIIKSQVLVSKQAAADADSEGLMTVDSVDGSVQTVFNLQWKKC